MDEPTALIVSEATRIAVKAGVLLECDLHEKVYQVSFDYDSAIGAKQGVLARSRNGIRNEVQEMTETIKIVIDPTPFECPTCKSRR